MMNFYLLLNLIFSKALLKDYLLNEFYYRISVIILLFSALLILVTGIGIYKELFHINLICQVLEIFLLVIGSLILISWPIQTIKKNSALLVILYLPSLILNITHAKLIKKMRIRDILYIKIFGLSLSVFTVFKSIIIILLLILSIYLLYIEKIKGNKVYDSIDSPMLLRCSGFLGASGRKTVRNLLILIGGSVNAYANYLSIRDEHFPREKLKNEHEAIYLKVKKENENLRIAEREIYNLENKNFNNEVFNYSTKNQLESLTNNSDKIIDKIQKQQDMKAELYNKSLSTTNVIEKGKILEEVRKCDALLNDNFLELSQLQKKVKEIKNDLENKVQADELLELKDKEKVSLKNNNDSKSNDNLSSSSEARGENSTPILSPLESDWYNSLSRIQQLCVTLLMFNSIIFSCVVSIIFTLYGEYLINRFSLESRYPKLARYIALRRKFQNYYLKINLLIIIIDLLIQMLLFILIIEL